MEKQKIPSEFLWGKNSQQTKG